MLLPRLLVVTQLQLVWKNLVDCWLVPESLDVKLLT
jgi:hypothetical protein